MKGIVFDLFHTLVDPEDFRPHGFRRVAETARVMKTDPGDFQDYWVSMTPFRNTNPVPLEDLLEGYGASRGVALGPGTLTECAGILSRYQDMAVMGPRREVLAMLEGVRELGYLIAVLSDADMMETRSFGRSPLAPFVDAVLLSWETGFLKPDPRAFHRAADVLGIPITSCAFAGDGGSDELIGAREAGCSPIIFVEAFVGRNGMRDPEWLAMAEKLSDMKVAAHSGLCAQLQRLHNIQPRTCR